MEKTISIHSGKVIKQNLKNGFENSIAYKRNPYQYVHNIVKHKNRIKCAKEIKNSLGKSIKQNKKYRVQKNIHEVEWLFIYLGCYRVLYVGPCSTAHPKNKETVVWVTGGEYDFLPKEKPWIIPTH